MRVELSPGGQTTRWVVLRPLTGHDELALDRERRDAGNILLDRLLTPAPGAMVGPGGLNALSVTDRDRLLAAVFRAAFGDRIDGVARCAGCSESFEFNFLLSELCAHQVSDSAPLDEGPDGEGFFCTADGVRFRPPTVGDVEAVHGLALDVAIAALVQRCTANGCGNADIAAVQSAMERVAPVLDIDIEARCPSCHAAQSIRFNLESYLLDALARERRFLTHEIHRLALSYCWGLDDILSLSRDDRRTLARLAELDRASRRRL